MTSESRWPTQEKEHPERFAEFFGQRAFGRANSGLSPIPEGRVAIRALPRPQGYQK